MKIKVVCLSPRSLGAAGWVGGSGGLEPVTVRNMIGISLSSPDELILI